MTSCCICGVPATCTLTYQRLSNLGMPVKAFCAERDREMHRQMQPLTNPDLKMWVYDARRA
jgi:hypothetical protein